MNIHSSLLLDKAIDLILDQLTDFKDFKARKKLTLKDVHQLIELCESECYFLWEDYIWKFLNLWLTE